MKMGLFVYTVAAALWPVVRKAYFSRAQHRYKTLSMASANQRIDYLLAFLFIQWHL